MSVSFYTVFFLNPSEQNKCKAAAATLCLLALPFTSSSLSICLNFKHNPSCLYPQYYYRLKSHSEQLKHYDSFCSHLLIPKTLACCTSSLKTRYYDLRSILLCFSCRHPKIVLCLFHFTTSFFLNPSE